MAWCFVCLIEAVWIAVTAKKKMSTLSYVGEVPVALHILTNAGYLAMWCGIANGAEDVLIPEKYDYDEQKLINNIIASRKAGKKHHIIVNAEGIGHSEAMARRIEAATGIETRATILGHMQRGGNPTCKDRVYASMMGALAVDLLVAGKSCRVVGYRHGEFMDFDINEALAMQKDVSPYMWEVCNSLSHNYNKK